MRRSVAIIAVLLAACGSPQSQAAKPPLTKRQHDSVIGTSGIPGASGIRAAQRVADSLDARNARLDSISHP